MSSIAERLRARLAENKNVTRSSSVAGSNDSSVHSDISRTGVSLYGVGREQCVENLKLAVALNIYGRKVCYPDYMEKGFAVCDALIDYEHIGWFKSYCIEPYPDVCYCGAEFLSNSGNLRRHCNVCKGEYKKSKVDAYTLQRLAMYIGIHESWIEYAAAWALVGHNSRTQ